jgi:hypothetical protein
VALLVGSFASAPVVASRPIEAPPYHARSTQPLFDEPFEVRRSASEGQLKKTASGGATRPRGSSRIDRIAMARAGEFRDNEFSRWGAR